LDPYPMLMSLATQAQQQLGANVQVHCSLDGSERLLWAPPNPCKQMVWNLIENSAKYADPSQPIELAITADLGDTYLQIQVADRGAQLSSQQCQDIFNPFYRLPSPKVQPGSGLGLTLVRRFADAMGGSVSARPREGGGLLVSLVLPRATPSERLQWGRCIRERERERFSILYRRPMIRNHPQERASSPPKGGKTSRSAAMATLQKAQEGRRSRGSGPIVQLAAPAPFFQGAIALLQPPSLCAAAAHQSPWLLRPNP